VIPGFRGGNDFPGDVPVRPVPVIDMLLPWPWPLGIDIEFDFEVEEGN